MAESRERCGIDTVEVARVARLVEASDAAALARLYSARELADAGEGPGRNASLAARFAAKEACLKLFPRETALETIAAADFSVERDAYGAPQVVPSAAAEAVMGRYRIGRIALSMSHDATSANAVAIAEHAPIDVPAIGRFVYRFLPLRRDVVIGNLQRVYGGRIDESEIVRLAQAHYAHLARLAGEFLRFRWLSPARKAALVRVENLEGPGGLRETHARGKGVLILTGHFGNWEVATVAGVQKFPEAHGRFHFVRRAIKPRWLEALVTRRFVRAGFGVLPKRGSLDALCERLEAGDLVVFPFDQHARGRDAVVVDFFGHPAGTFRSLAIIAQATGAPVVPASSWREPDGTHVLRFERPLEAVADADPRVEVAANTRAFNAALERLVVRRPEQWWWVHRRWKATEGSRVG
ncbi:MAG: 4'-phosphopantetheinyl transferase superfamily protein [Burkholderiales bacterium]|jgi:KDO2-lipid IV(A) lauroyltransferase|nr:4'-phosphopantetheinyl transferase superfamily protein [Burkholderiales bacterium]